jgi:hypothetical protein
VFDDVVLVLDEVIADSLLQLGRLGAMRPGLTNNRCGATIGWLDGNGLGFGSLHSTVALPLTGTLTAIGTPPSLWRAGGGGCLTG